MRRTRTGLFCASLLWLVVPAGTAQAAAVPHRECPGFSYQEDAQSYFAANGGAAGPAAALDQDGNGVACEVLPIRGSVSILPRVVSFAVSPSPVVVPTPTSLEASTSTSYTLSIVLDKPVVLLSGYVADGSADGRFAYFVSPVSESGVLDQLHWSATLSVSSTDAPGSYALGELEALWVEPDQPHESLDSGVTSSQALSWDVQVPPALVPVAPAPAPVERPVPAVPPVPVRPTAAPTPAPVLRRPAVQVSFAVDRARVEKGSVLHFSGRTNPAKAGRRVTLQARPQRTDSRWVTVAQGATSRTGAFRLASRASSTRLYRVVAAGDATHRLAGSAARLVRVTTTGPASRRDRPPAG